MAEAEKEIVGLLLAAGVSHRFGSDKLRFQLPDGRAMAVAAASSLRPACDRLIAVIRPGNDELALGLSEAGCEIIQAADAEKGIGNSLAAGIRAAPDAGGWILALGDMPYIDTRSHQRIRDSLRAGASLTATRYREQRGHPVGFSRHWYTQLATLSGDQGGKAILQQHPDQLVLCPVDDPGVVRDIDTPADLVSTGMGSA